MSYGKTLNFEINIQNTLLNEFMNEHNEEVLIKYKSMPDFKALLPFYLKKNVTNIDK